MRAHSIISSGIIAVFSISGLVFAAPAASAAIEASPAVNTTPDEVHGLPVVPMAWHAPPTASDGTEIVLTGTIQDITPQFKELGLEASEKTSSNEPSLVKRYFKGRPVCTPQVGPLVGAQWKVIYNDGYKKLQQMAGWFCGAAPNTCSMAYCSSNSGVFLCNQRTTWIGLDCARVGMAAREVAGDCSRLGPYVAGLWRDTIGYTVEVHRC
ncbi:hypothetical protein TWF730_010496 [Orbilia blumenaviensis]|uniref:Secreted protein n=1 Tax=Orbilia blumenaviensis TaxID=1796055 RepID=A0AAV9UPM7_9PEZI